MTGRPLPEPLIADASQGIAAYRQGYGLGNEQRVNALNTQAGALAASGDMKGASNALLAGGEMDAGMKIQDRMQAAEDRKRLLGMQSTKMGWEVEDRKLAKAERVNNAFARMAIAVKNAPEEQRGALWGQVLETGKKMGADVTGYEDPSSIDLALSKSLETKEYLAYLKNQASAGAKAEGLLSDDAVTQAADYYIKSGGKMPPLGQGSIGSTNRAKVLEAVTRLSRDQGGSASDIVNNHVDLTARSAGARTGGSQEMKMMIAAQEITNLAPIALEKMNALATSRGSFMPFNQLVEAAQKGTNDPRVREAALANQSLVSNYAAVIGRGSPQITDSAREHAENLLKTTFDQESYNAVVKLMLQEADLAKKAPSQIREQNRQEHGGGVVAPSVPKPTVSAPAGAVNAAPRPVASQAEYQALPPGTQYQAPDGSIRTKQ